MRFQLEIDMDNEAMQTPGDVAEALERLSRRIDHRRLGDLAGFTGGSIHDLNGNTIGRWEFTEAVTNPPGGNTP